MLSSELWLGAVLLLENNVGQQRRYLPWWSVLTLFMESVLLVLFKFDVHSNEEAEDVGVGERPPASLGWGGRGGGTDHSPGWWEDSRSWPRLQVYQSVVNVSHQRGGC